MKHYFIIVLLCAITSVQGQKNIDQIFRKYKNDEGVVNMNFTGKILDVLKKSEHKIKSTVDLVDVIIFEKKNDLSVKDKNKIAETLQNSKYEILIDVKNKDQKIKLFAIDNGKYLSNIYAHINSEDVNAYFILSGKIVFEELSKLGMDFQNGNAFNLFDTKDKKVK